MTTSQRPYFARPIEFISAGTDFAFGATPGAITSGVYANIISLFREFADQAGTSVDDVGMTDDLKLKFKAGDTLTLTWRNTTLRNSFGFTGASLAITDGSWYTATYTPLYIWYPERQKADQSVFRRDPKDQFIGGKSLTGNLAGIGTGSTKYYRTMRFVNELGSRLGYELAESTADALRCLELFFQDSINAAPTVSTHPCTKGFWYYDDVNEFIADCTMTGSEWGDSGGVQFALSSSPDTYVFCMFDPLGLSEWDKSPTFSVSRLRYTVEVSFTTATAATFL
jgi:hypothetical protein